MYASSEFDWGYVRPGHIPYRIESVRRSITTKVTEGYLTDFCLIAEMQRWLACYVQPAGVVWPQIEQFHS